MYTQANHNRVTVSPQKRLGQNFLIDEGICANIAAAGNVKGIEVLEVGAGTGNLTQMLLASGAASVTAIEFDERCVSVLSELQLQHRNLKVIKADALQFDEATLGTNINVVANLPYNIGSRLLVKWLQNIHLFSKITIMLQEEVVDRVTAQHENSNYGFLSVMAQFRCYVEKLFTVPATAFWPAPKVTSAVLQVFPIKTQELCSYTQLETVVKAAFSQRRKMLRHNMKPLLGSKLQEIFAELSIPETARAEELSVKQFCKLANLVYRN